MADERLSR